MRLIGLLVLLGLGGICALENLVCLKNHTVLEMSGDAVLSVFIETDYGPECNISSPKSVQEVATALFVAQSLNRMEYVPGVTIGLRLYDTCNDRISVYKQALISAVEMDCSAHYDLGILAPERYLEVLEPLRSLDLLPVNTYGPANLVQPLVDVLVDFLSTRYSSVDQLLADSRPVLDRFVQQTKQAGICLRKDKDLELYSPPTNQTEKLLVAVGNYDDISVWLGELDGLAAEDNSITWVVLPLDNSHVDDMLPEGSFVIRPEQFMVELGPDVEASDLSQIPASTLLRSPHLLSVGKAVLEIASQLKQLQSKSCGSEVAGCVLPRFEWTKQDSMSNADLYETLKVPAMAHSTRYVVARKVDGAMEEVTAYKIDATSARYRAIAEKEVARVPRLCVKKLAKNCEACANFQIVEPEEAGDAEEGEIGLMKPQIWVPIFLTLVVLGCITCVGVFVFIVYRFYVEEILDGNPSFTLILIGATMMLLLSLVLFCLEDQSVGPGSLNSWKIYTTSLSFGLVFSVMLTRALFLSFSTTGVFHTQHINGYLQSFMLFFMASVELAISTMYFAFSTSNAAHVMRSPGYVGLLSYDIFLLLLTFIACSFTAQIHRNYREGTCFFGTAIGLLICWAVWVTCFALLSADKRDLIVCFGILSTAGLVIVGILVPRTYFMYERFSREKNLVGRFEVTDLGPDPRMNTTARQVLDSQSRQAFYEYVSPEVQPQLQQAAVSPAPNYYGASSLNPIGRLSLRQRSPEPRRTPGYNNYGFVRPEMREVEPASSAYGAPRLYVDETDGQPGPSVKSVSSASTPVVAAVPEARYALPRSLLRKVRGSIKRSVRPGSAVVESEVHAAPDRVSPARSGYLAPGPARSHSPSNLAFNRVAPDEHPTRVTRF